MIFKGNITSEVKVSKSMNSKLFGYTDADWANDQDDRRSCTGYIFLKNGGIAKRDRQLLSHLQKQNTWHYPQQLKKPFGYKMSN